jgi:hypothetical protein
MVPLKIFLRRMTICLVAAFLLNGFVFLTIDHIPYPDFLRRLLGLPDLLCYYYLSATEPLPTDDLPIYEAGRAAQCFFITFVLNIPYYALSIYGLWWLLDKFRQWQMS